MFGRQDAEVEEGFLASQTPPGMTCFFCVAITRKQVLAEDVFYFVEEGGASFGGFVF
jgi:hypothetical protein